MAELSDETLMAYADGELPAAERVRVETILHKDAASRARLAMFMATGKALAVHFREPMDEPVPRRLVELVLGGREKASKTSMTRRPDARPGWSSSIAAGLEGVVAAVWPRWPMALAYSAVLLAGTGAGWYLRDTALRTTVASGKLIVQENGRILAHGALRQALESGASGAPILASGRRGAGATVRTRLTFRTHENGYCRHYEAAQADGDQFAGVGCRIGEGLWQVKIHTPIAPRPTAATATIVVGDDGSAAVTALVGRLMEGDALGAEAEAEILGKQWRP